MQSRNLVNNFSSIPTDINLILLQRLSMYVTVYPGKLAEPFNEDASQTDTTTKGGNATLNCQNCAENVNTRTCENFYLHHARHKPLPSFVVFISKHVFSIQENEPHARERQKDAGPDSYSGTTISLPCTTLHISNISKKMNPYS
jgi:hypothetical protein